MSELCAIGGKMDDVKIICERLPEGIRQRGEELVHNILFMEDRLKDTREKAAKMDMVIPYDNGGGQKGIRKNPVFEEYAQIFNAYKAGLAQLTAMVEAHGNARPEAKSKLAELRVIAGDLKKAQ